MADRYDVAIKVVSKQGTCAHGHEVGDEWLCTGKTPAGICLSAFNALLPSVRVLMFGGTFPWSSDPDTTTVACPDAANPVVFEVGRVRK